VENEFPVRGSANVFVEPTFKFDGFDVEQVKLVDFVPVASMANGFASRAFLHFEDAFGRTAAVDLSADYTVSKDGITLLSAVWRPLYPAYPRTKAFIVPIAAFSKAPAGSGRNFGTDITFAAENAVSMTDPSSATGMAENYAIMIFAMDRIASDALFQAKVAAPGPSRTAGYAEKSRYVEYDVGWRAAIIPGKFPLTTKEADVFWIKAVYTPGQDSPANLRGARVVGLFSNKPAAKPGS
jgi:hypothetical protein